MIDQNAVTRSRLIILAVIAAATVYKLANFTGFGTSSAMFIGIPAVLAAIVTFSPPGKTTTGTIMKATTILLLLAGILLVEGVVCILMAAPLIYGVAAVVGVAVEWVRKADREQGTAFRVSIIVPIFIASMQGSIPGTPLSRDVEGVAVRMVDMTPGEVENALGRPPKFEQNLPAFFKYGQFPRPLSCTISGDRLVIDFEMLEPSRHKMNGHEHEMTSQLILERTVTEPGRIVFEPVKDTTMMSQWVTLTSSTVEWSAVGERTRVEWTIEAQRKLDPAWYFGPMQNYAAQRAADYLITATIG